MILGRLGVRDKLNLLLLLPLTTIILMSVPFIADRVGDARAAAATASTARTAQQAGSLIQELQRERLLSLAYLVSPGANRSPLISQAQNVSDQAADMRGALGPRVERGLSAALAGLDRLGPIRDRVRQRSVEPKLVHQAFDDAITGLLDALGLTPQNFVDAVGARQVGALDALLRANEESGSAGTALLVAALDQESGSALLIQATRMQQLHSERFLQLATPVQVRLLRLVDASQATREVDALIDQVRHGPGKSDAAALAAAVLAAVDSQTGLQRLVEGRITRDIADGAAARARDARIAAWVFAGSTVVLFAVVVGLSVRVSRSIAGPLRRLTFAAGAVADLAGAELIRVSDEENPERTAPRLAAIDVITEDEVGELAAAFNQVQATAALLLERQVVSRSNVAAMFANVGRRTRNLVGRQLALIDDLERDEKDPELLARLYRLDHVSARLRRSAYSLLVVSGARDEGYVTEPASIATVVRSALGEIEGFQQIRLGEICDVVAAPDLVADLVLMLAELLENATSFSPPGMPVDVHAEMVDDGCRISVVDRGIGMSSEELDEENRRLIERERLDIVPTSVLGLFVVGRLARRHGLSVHLSQTPGQGVTAQIGIPASYLSAAVDVPAAPPAPSFPPPIATALAALPVPESSGHFSWFSIEEPTGDANRPEQPPPKPMEPVDAELAARPTQGADAGTEPKAAAAATHGTLTRRVPGAQLPEVEPEPRSGQPPRWTRDPDAARAVVEAFQAGVERAARHEPAAANEPSSRNGLTRRAPGTHLAAALRTDQKHPAPSSASQGTDPRRAPARAARDPDSERAALDAFIQGFEEGSARSGTPPRPEGHRRSEARPEGGSR